MCICTVTGQKYFVKGELHFSSCNVIYLVECSNCKQQYIDSVLNFKQRFRIHKSDIKTNKDRCGTARYFNNACYHPSNPHFYLKVQLIEQVFCNDVDKDIEVILWEREKYWQSQLFTNVYGTNSIFKEIIFLSSILLFKSLTYFAFKPLTYLYSFIS